jgi:hypothetical protein
MKVAAAWRPRQPWIKAAMPEFRKGIFSCPVLANEEVARGIFLMRLRAPEIAAAVWPGQFVNVKVSSEEQAPADSSALCHSPLATCHPLLRRPFSVCQVDRRAGAIDLIWKVIGPGTSLLASHRPGTGLSLIGPLGHGFELPPDPVSIVLVAGGVGVAPLPILAMELAARQSVKYSLRCYLALVLQTSFGANVSWQRSEVKSKLQRMTAAPAKKGLSPNCSRRGWLNIHFDNHKFSPVAQCPC